MNTEWLYFFLFFFGRYFQQIGTDVLLLVIAVSQELYGRVRKSNH